MAIIPAENKVFMVSNSTNTTYSGSAALKAMQQWYTMQDIIDTVGGGGAPTLQEVTTAGNTTNQTINIADYIGNYGLQIDTVDSTGLKINLLGNGTAINVYQPYNGEEPAVIIQSAGENITLAVVGTAAKTGGGEWDVYSDARVKENIKPYTKGLNDILLVNTINYEYNGLGQTTKGGVHTGIIAQEIKEIFPNTVNTYKAKLNEDDEEKTELYRFNGSELTFALINAIKELKAEIDLLKSK